LYLSKKITTFATLKIELMHIKSAVQKNESLFKYKQNVIADILLNPVWNKDINIFKYLSDTY
jgi:hypothetical protein